MAFENGAQTPAEDVVKYLDALESLRSQAYPKENKQEREKAIVRRFIAGLRDADLKRTILTWQMIRDINQNYSIEQIRNKMTKNLLSRPKNDYRQQPYNQSTTSKGVAESFQAIGPRPAVAPTEMAFRSVIPTVIKKPLHINTNMGQSQGAQTAQPSAQPNAKSDMEGVQC